MAGEQRRLQAARRMGLTQPQPKGLFSKLRASLFGNSTPLQWAAMTFDAARMRRRLSRWIPSDQTHNAMLAYGGTLLRNRARDAVRNNPYLASASEAFCANVIGTGIKPSPTTADLKVRRTIQTAWNTWVKECDADGLVDFYGMQEMATRALFESGEVFIRFRPRRMSDGFSVPLQLQAIESDLVPYFDIRISPVNPNNWIKNGIEFDPLGRRVAYWFYPYHPGELTLTMRTDWRFQVRVPADQVLHIFRPKRPGDVRGMPLVQPALVKAWLLDQYDDAELDRQKTSAMFAAFIRSPTPEDFAADAEPGSAPDEGIVTLEPGTISTLLPGEEIDFATPPGISGSYEAFQYRQLLAIFSALGIPYSLGTSDLRRANYSSLRGAMIEFRRRITQIQHNCLIFQMCQPIWERWITEARVQGLELPDFGTDPAPYINTKWMPPRFDWVDPLKDQQAEKLAVDSGFKPRSDVIEELGDDPEETDDRIKADKDREKKLGLDFPAAKAAKPGQAGDGRGGGGSGGRGGGGGFPGARMRKPTNFDVFLSKDEGGATARSAVAELLWEKFLARHGAKGPVEK